jgi:glyoxylate utilization-related uncharacterized protein
MKTAKIKSMILCYDLKCYDYQYIPKRNKKKLCENGKKSEKRLSNIKKKYLHLSR